MINIVIMINWMQEMENHSVPSLTMIMIGKGTAFSTFGRQVINYFLINYHVVYIPFVFFCKKIQNFLSTLSRLKDGTLATSPSAASGSQATWSAA